MAIAQQEMRRVSRLGAGIFTVCLDMSLNDNGTPFTPMSPDLVADIEVTRTQNRNYALADGFHRLAKKDNTFPLFLRYKAQAERLYRRAVEEFERVKALRDEFPMEPISDPQPEENEPDPTPPEEPITDPQPNPPAPESRPESGESPNEPISDPQPEENEPDPTPPEEPITDPQPNPPAPESRPESGEAPSVSEGALAPSDVPEGGADDLVVCAPRPLTVPERCLHPTRRHPVTAKLSMSAQTPSWRVFPLPGIPSIHGKVNPVRPRAAMRSAVS
jgi:hypothetical protein